MIFPSTVYLNGQFMSKDKASVSPDDRGFYFADGVYEVIKYYKGQPFCFAEHMMRLRNSLAGIRIDYQELERLSDICNALISANQLNDKYAGVYIQITRGVAERTHRFPADKIMPTVYVRAFPMPAYMEEMRNGIRVIACEDIRWLRCNIKSIALLPNTLMFEEVAAQGAFECMFVRNGCITEASHSNILAVKKGVVHTHPDSNFILPGITKDATLKLCRSLQIKVVEQPIRITEIKKFDEWFITGTGSEIVPIVQIDETKIGNGKPGPVTRLLQKEFLRITYEQLAGEKLLLQSAKSARSASNP
jgi:D-alanine transaminase